MAVQQKPSAGLVHLDWRNDPAVIAYHQRRAELTANVPNLNDQLVQANQRIYELEAQLADAATLAARFGIDIHAIDFWRSSLDTIREEITQFEGLMGK